MNRSKAPALIFLCFFFSGIAGLMYEVIWIRQLSLIFGATSFAISTVLASFMGGLALGSYYFGKIADRRRDHLKLYAILEGTIAVYCLILPFLFKAITGVYVLTWRSMGGSFYSMSLLRFALCAVLLLLPTTFMGATLPILSRYAIRRIDKFGAGFGRLYGINTFGAVLGCFAAGYFLIGTIGVWKTTILAAVLNVVVALIAWTLHRSEGDSPEWEGDEDRAAAIRREEAGENGPVRAVIVGIALAGWASLVYEVCWTRLLSLVLGSSVYAFTAMLTTFLLGIALGSMAVSALADRIRSPFRAFVSIQIAVGISSLLITPLFDRLPRLFIMLFTSMGSGFFNYQLIQFAICVLVMIVPTFFIGAALPLAAKAASNQLGRLGRSVGTIYASNTVGAIVGSFMAGFILIPLLGTQMTLSTAAGVNIFVGLLVLMLLPRIRTAIRIGVPVAAVAALLLLGGGGDKWDRYQLNAGLFDSPEFSVGNIVQKGFADYIYSYDIRFFEEGTYANVAVSQEDNSLFLQINGRTEASTSSDMVNQILVTQIPMLVHPDPRDVLVIGLGSGITFGSVLTHPVASAECVEISPAVARAATYFREWNFDVMRNPAAKVILDDGRNYLLATSKQYDVIISEPSKPWITGVSNMFTRETYELAKARLKPRGIVCQWFHYYSMAPDDFRLALRTFLDVFPYAQVWNADNNVFMLGANEPLLIDVTDMERKLSRPDVNSDLSRVRLASPYLLLGHYLFGEKEAREYVGEGPINTDDLPLIEFSAPRNRNSFHHEEILDSMLGLYPKFSSYPLTGHIVHDGNLLDYKLAKFQFTSPVEWQTGVANMERNVIPAERLGSDKSGVVVAYRVEGKMAGKSGEEGAVTAFTRGAFSDDKLARTIDLIASGPVEKGEAIVNGHRAHWGLFEADGRPMAALTWFCEDNLFQYLIRMVGTADDDAAAIRDLLLDGSLCRHDIKKDEQ